MEAAALIDKNPTALELRRLQTLEKMAKEPSQHTIVVPMDWSQAVVGLSAATPVGGGQQEKREHRVFSAADWERHK